MKIILNKKWTTPTGKVLPKGKALTVDSVLGAELIRKKIARAEGDVLAGLLRKRPIKDKPLATSKDHKVKDKDE